MADPGFQVLSDKIAMLRVIGENLTDECVADVAEVINADVKGTIAAGTDPDGTPWPPNKDGSKFTFVKPSDVVTGSIGQTIITRIKSRVPVLHHFGYARGNVERRVLPTGGKLPKRLDLKIRAAIERRFVAATGGSK